MSLNDTDPTPSTSSDPLQSLVDSIGSKAGVQTRREEATALMKAAGLEPDPWQVDLLTSSWDRALLNVCRQGGKSTTTAALALNTALGASDALVLIAAPARRQSKELLHKIRGLYRDARPDIGVEKASELRMRLGNGSRIIALPGREATTRGYSDPHLIVADEAARVPNGLYEALRPMLGVSQGRFVALTTPAGQRGWFYDAWTDPEQEWKRVKVTGQDCPRLSGEFLERERREMGEWRFANEYECEFQDTEDQFFATERIDGMFSSDVEPLFSAAGADQILSDTEPIFNDDTDQ
jgi:hypothetical protein